MHDTSEDKVMELSHHGQKQLFDIGVSLTGSAGMVRRWVREGLHWPLAGAELGRCSLAWLTLPGPRLLARGGNPAGPSLP